MVELKNENKNWIEVIEFLAESCSSQMTDIIESSGSIFYNQQMSLNSEDILKAYVTHKVSEVMSKKGSPARCLVVPMDTDNTSIIKDNISLFIILHKNKQFVLNAHWYPLVLDNELDYDGIIYMSKESKGIAIVSKNLNFIDGEETLTWAFNNIKKSYDIIVLSEFDIKKF